MATTWRYSPSTNARMRSSSLSTLVSVGGGGGCSARARTIPPCKRGAPAASRRTGGGSGCLGMALSLTWMSMPPLREDDVDPDPIVQFRRWYHDAEVRGVLAADAMIVASATPDGRPSARVVLLRGLDERGFAFYTNFESRKGRELDANPHAAVALPLARSASAGARDGEGRTGVASRVRAVLGQPAARESYQRMGVGAERDDRIARRARGTGRGSRGALR